jgi:hypothetical protein
MLDPASPAKRLPGLDRGWLAAAALAVLVPNGTLAVWMQAASRAP